MLTTYRKHGLLMAYATKVPDEHLTMLVLHKLAVGGAPAGALGRFHPLHQRLSPVARDLSNDFPLRPRNFCFLLLPHMLRARRREGGGGKS